MAIILDGNGRWAAARGWPRAAGHRAGARMVRRIVESAPGLGIEHLTLYAFSSDNWERPQREVTVLMRLFRVYLASETERCIANGIRLSVIGRRDRLPDHLVRMIRSTEAATAEGRAMHLRIALDYSARHALLAAAARVPAGKEPTRAEFARCVAEVVHAREPIPDVDLLIRTGGEQRLSDYLLWECAYAEFLFSDTMWPDFGPEALAGAVAEFGQRERRFGRVLEAQAAAG